jgi:general nucleoside transport system permease protein
VDRLLTLSFWSATLAGGLRLATPLIFASLGETMSQRAGVLNIGVEGYMIVGALTSLYVAVETSLIVGLIAGALAGGLLALAMVGLSLRLGANQVVVGFGITIFGLGLTGYIFRVTTDVGAARRQVGRQAAVDIPFLSDIPLVGAGLFSNSWMTWFALACVPAMWWLAQRTTFGLQVRAVGEDPDAAAARGVAVVRVRSAATLLSGVFGGLGGAAISISLVGVFEPNITARRGFIALIVIIMASWNIWGAALGSFVFGFFEAFGTNLRNVVSGDVPTEALRAIPFIVALLILILGARRARMPRSLGVNYRPDS